MKLLAEQIQKRNNYKMNKLMKGTNYIQDKQTKYNKKNVSEHLFLQSAQQYEYCLQMQNN